MNKIPKCSKKMIPIIKSKKSNNQLNYNKNNILSTTKSFGNDITNIIKNKKTKKSSSCNEKVSKYIIIYYSIFYLE